MIFVVAFLMFSIAPTIQTDCGQTIENGFAMAAGVDLTTEEAPWVFSILNDAGKVHCGGSVISETLLLTAAHCVHPTIDLSNFQLVFGTNKPEVPDTTRVVRSFTRSNVVLHPDYNYPEAYDDVALIRLKQEDQLSFDGNIRKLCLPKETNVEPNKWFRNQINLVGYGKTRQDLTSKLRSATMVIMPNPVCLNQLNNGIEAFRSIRISLPDEPMIKKNQLCSGVSGLSGGDSGSCAGDSGSPAIFFDWTRDAYTQIGVLHGGVTQCNSQQFPSIYTRLDEPGILQFIQDEQNNYDLCGEDHTKCKYGVCRWKDCKKNIPWTHRCEGQCIPKSWLKDGEEDCTDGSDEKKINVRLMITTGTLGYGPAIMDDYVNKTEVIDIEDDNLICENLADFPKELTNAMSGLLNGVPVICGGITNRRLGIQDQCYSLSPTGLWKHFVKMDVPRYSSGSIVLGGKMWITGGKRRVFDETKLTELESSLFVFENGTITEGPNIFQPNTMENCMAQLENGKLFVVPFALEGRYSSPMNDNTMIVDPQTFDVSPGPNLPKKTSGCKAISFRSPAHGGRTVVAIMTRDDFHILDTTTNTWETNVPEVPFKTRSGPEFLLASELLLAPSGDGFITVSGKNIFQFKCKLTGCEWIEKSQKLKQNHYNGVSMFIPNSLTNCIRK